MPRSRRRTPRAASQRTPRASLPLAATVVVIAATIIGLAACGQVQPTASGAPSGDVAPSASASTSPFQPTAYPPDGDAPCDQLEAPDADHAAYAGAIRRIRSIDMRTVVFELCAPDVAFPTRLASPAFAINDTSWLESHIDPNRGGDQSIVHEVNGTGPYRLDSWNRGSEITMVRNETWRGEPARTERLVIRWRGDAAGRLADLQGGSVDGIDDVAPGDVPTLERDATLQAVPRPGLNVFYVGFNNTYAPFDDPRVRRAIAMGIDRDRIVQTLYPPGSEVASHFAPCAIYYGCAGGPWYRFDPSAARQLLAEAGFPAGFETTIQYRDVVRPYLPDPTAVALELKAQLEAHLGIRAELVALPEETFLATVDEGRSDGIHLLGRNASIPEVSDLLDPHFGAGATREFGTPVDDLADTLAVGSSTNDAKTRTAAYRAATAAIRANVPMIPVAHAGSMTAYRADVAGAQSSPVRQERFAAMTAGDRRQFVWLAAEEPAGLYCADETSAVAQLVCSQLTEGLYAFAPGSAAATPALAQICKPNPELTIWTCTLRSGVTFHDGAALDANDVVLSFAAQWDAEHRLHRGREGRFESFIGTFGGLLNPPRQPG